MSMYQVLLVDHELTSRRCAAALLADVPNVQLVAEAATGSEAIDLALRLQPDIVLLDVHLPDTTGFEVLQAIWPHHQPAVVFTATSNQHAVRAFDVSAADYLLKPYSPERFVQALQRARQQRSPAHEPDLDWVVQLLRHTGDKARAGSSRILVKDQRRIFFVKPEDVLYFDADGNYITLHTANKNYTVYDSLTRLQQKLDPRQFARINRSVIVNLNYVADLEGYFNGEYLVNLSNGQQLKWTRMYRDNAKAFLTQSL